MKQSDATKIRNITLAGHLGSTPPDKTVTILLLLSNKTTFWKAWLKLENDENYSRIDSSINLEEVKRIAIQELGMRYAEEGQIVTFSGEGSDYVRQTGEIPD